jgi:aryl-alcohol dehydrogenase-like predicted oxidoreductase
MEARKCRDLMFIATKYKTNYRSWELGKGETVNYYGNHRKSLHLSVRDSLAKLKTDYIDLMYLHWWDWTTSIREVMDALHIFVEQGKVLYLGISDAPVWIVAAANTYAIQQGKTPFSVYQGRWNVIRRDVERDIIPMARQFGMAICPWDVLGGGKFQTKKQLGEGAKSPQISRSSSQQTDDERRASDVLEQVAVEHGEDTTIQQIALAYVMHKTRNVFPMIGFRKVENLIENLKALDICLTNEQMQRLDSVKELDIVSL